MNDEDKKTIVAYCENVVQRCAGYANSDRGLPLTKEALETAHLATSLANFYEKYKSPNAEMESAMDRMKEEADRERAAAAVTPPEDAPSAIPEVQDGEEFPSA